MKSQKSTKNILGLFKLIYQKIFLINDTPQKIAIGFGLGVFSGILPGTGPVASLFLAFLFRVNRASALLGSLLTNTWLSLVTFLLSVRIGSTIMHLDWQDLYLEWLGLLKSFRIVNLFRLSALKIILPVMLGYLIVAASLGLLAYLSILTIFTQIKIRRKE